MGDYPGAIKTDDDSEVEGDVFEVLDLEKVFAILDAYEGEEYERSLTGVKMDSGDEVQAWVYWLKVDVN